MAEVWYNIMLWPLSGRVALLLAILWIVWLLLGKLLIRVFSLIPFCLRKILLAVYRLIDFPLGLLHSKLAGLFDRMDKGWTNVMSRICKGLQLWYRKWRHPQKYYSMRVVLLFGIIFVWAILPSTLGLDGAIIRGAENTYLQIEQWITEKVPVVVEIGYSSLPLEAPPTISPSPTPDPTPTPERIVTGLRTRLIVRDKPSVSLGKELTYLENGDVVYDLGEQETGDTGDGTKESWLKIQTKDDIIGWVRDNYLSDSEKN